MLSVKSNVSFTFVKRDVIEVEVWRQGHAAEIETRNQVQDVGIWERQLQTQVHLRSILPIGGRQNGEPVAARSEDKFVGERRVDDGRQVDDAGLGRLIERHRA